MGKPVIVPSLPSEPGQQGTRSVVKRAQATGELAPQSSAIETLKQSAIGAGNAAGNKRLHPVAERTKNLMLLSRQQHDGTVRALGKGVPAIRVRQARTMEVVRLIHDILAAAEENNIESGPCTERTDGLEFRRGRVRATLSIDEKLDRLHSEGNNVASPKLGAALQFDLRLVWAESESSSASDIADKILNCMNDYFE